MGRNDAFVLFCRQLERQGQEEEHHWDRPSETPEGRLPQIQVRFSVDLKSFKLKRSRISASKCTASSEMNLLCKPSAACTFGLVLFGFYFNSEDEMQSIFIMNVKLSIKHTAFTDWGYKHDAEC